MKKFKLLASVLLAAKLTAQTFTPGLSVYGEAYAGYDFNQPSSQTRPGFIVNHHRLNEVTLNLIRIDYGHTAGERSRFKLALQTGTYVERNLAGEPPALRPLAEAYLGFKAKKHNIWFDFGVFDSHIGFESTKGSNNDMLSRTLMAENSPYFESGMRAMYILPRVRFGLFVLNGWQQIRRTIPVNCGPALGTQIQWIAGGFTINSSTFFGVLSPAPYRYSRFLHNFWMSYSSNNTEHKVTFSADAGLQRISYPNRQGNSYWGAGALIYRWNATQRWAFSVRGELFFDPDFVLIPPITAQATTIMFWGGAADVEFKITNSIVGRAEVRSLACDNPYFLKSIDNSTPFPTDVVRKNSIWTGFTLSYSVPNIRLFDSKNMLETQDVEIKDE